MERKNPLPLRILDRLRSRAMFWRILLLYLGCSVLLLGVFSAVLTGILTRHAAANTIARDNDALSQAYAAAEYVLNTTYDVYYKMYATSDVSDLLFDTITPTAEADLAAGRLLRRSRPTAIAWPRFILSTAGGIACGPVMARSARSMIFGTRRRSDCSNFITKTQTPSFCPAPPPCLTMAAALLSR